MSIPNSNDCCPCTVSQVPYAPAVAAAIWTLALSTSSESEVGQLWSWEMPRKKDDWDLSNKNQQKVG